MLKVKFASETGYAWSRVARAVCLIDDQRRLFTTLTLSLRFRRGVRATCSNAMSRAAIKESESVCMLHSLMEDGRRMSMMSGRGRTTRGFVAPQSHHSAFLLSISFFILNVEHTTVTSGNSKHLIAYPVILSALYAQTRSTNPTQTPLTTPNPFVSRPNPFPCTS